MRRTVYVLVLWRSVANRKQWTLSVRGIRWLPSIRLARAGRQGFWAPVNARRINEKLLYGFGILGVYPGL